MELSRKRVLVLGLGMSGISAANFCAARGASVLAADEAPEERLRDLGALSSIVERSIGCPWPNLADFDLVVPSPGIPSERYASRAKAVAGDIELAGQFLDIPIVAVTGTNGKSTTVSLVEAMLKSAGLRAKAAGNLGIPALSLVGEPLDIAVLEVSSFQLEAIDTFRPTIAAVLNVTPDHLDRHGDFEGYCGAKARILENQTATDTAILNFDDAASRGLAGNCNARVTGFSRRGQVDVGAYLDSGAVLVRTPKGDQRVSLDGLNLAGVHNLENVLAAVAIISALGVDPARAIAALHDFTGLPHRSEVVATIAGTTYVNDSKATNPGAALGAIEGLDAPVIWLAGGRNKGLSFESLADTAARRVKTAIFFGESAAPLRAAVGERIDVRCVHDLATAVREAASIAVPGDVVLLAPACTSLDQFESFEHRGESFRSEVRALSQESQQS